MALLSKTDALNHGTVHAYDPATGRLLSRTWARSVDGVRVKATYGYDGAGRLETITYNDGTPGVTHTYHPDGRPKTTEDAAGLHTYLYAGPNGALSGETISGGGLLAGAVMNYGYDDQKRRDQHTWTWGSGQTRTTGLTFDTAGRLHTVTAFGQMATYGYEAGTGRLDTLAYTGKGSLTGSWTYDERGRLDVVNWQRGVDTVSRHDYGYATAMNRRTSALRETGDEWRYGYNLRGEVESAAKAQGTAANAPLWKGLVSGYGYDGIGNRTTETVDTPTGTETLDWMPNAVNQITEREVARGKWVLGRVHPEAALTAKKDGVDFPNGSVLREGENFAVPVEAGLAVGEPAWKALILSASREGVGKNGATLQQTQTGSLWFAASPESLTYDEDGNLKTDGRWLYLWDAENRLKAMETQASAIAAGVPAMRLEFAYDAMGRRIRKALYQLETLNSQPETWALKSDHRYLYDGWNLVAEFDKLTASPRLVRAYAWGRDLSGTQQGAGGVGGLVLAQSRDAGSTTVNNGQPRLTVCAPAYDGNGNISAYLDLANGRVIARLDYDAFGKPVWSELSSTVGAGDRIPFGFSTKYEDRETGLLYYGYRYYAPELGRWLNRDPIEEDGGINLYGMVENDAVNFLDYLGQRTFKDFSPNYRSIVEQKVPTGYGATAYQPSESGLTAEMLSFYFRGTPGPFSSMRARTDDSMDISKTSALKDNFEKVDKEVVADFFGDKLSKAVKEMRKVNSGHIGLHIADSPSGMVSTLLTQAALQHVTVSFEMSCDLENSCGGICRANLALYDLYDFKANGNLDKPLDWILHQGLGPGGLKAGTPYHVFGVWQRKYTFDEFFKITKAENIR